LKKLEEVQRIGYGTTIIKRSLNDPSVPAIILPNLKLPGFKSLKMMSLDDGDASDVSTDRKHRTRNSARWSRRESLGNPLKRPSFLNIPVCNEEFSCSPPKKTSRPLSRFASPLLPKSTSNDFGYENFSVRKRGKISNELLKELQRISKTSFKFERQKPKIGK